jgi:glucosylceramidase
MALCLAACGAVALAQQGPIESWITTHDRAALFQKQTGAVTFQAGVALHGGAIVVDPRQAYQGIDGFGFALTGGSAELLMKMSAPARDRVLRQIFSLEGTGAGVSYLRLTIGASDLNSFVFSYDDLPAGASDPTLEKFDLGQDKKDVLPVLKEILALQPGIKLLGSPWSAPAWMKTNGNVRGGSLKKECYPAYALYLVKYILAMDREGVTIDAITIQNEPLNSRNTPSMQWQVSEQLEFLRAHLAPAFARAGLKTKVILFDHNCDRPDYPLALLSDPVISRLADGTGFHHYGGDMSAMSLVHAARPDKNLYFTEQMVIEPPRAATIDIAPTVRRMLVDTTRNWAKNVILWNLAADPENRPHTDNGGCPMCQGAITVDKDEVGYNLAYYTIAHASRLVTPGSVRIYSTARGETSVSLTDDEERAGVQRIAATENRSALPNAAFRRPDGKIVLIVANDTGEDAEFTVQCDGAVARLKLVAGGVGTYLW